MPTGDSVLIQEPTGTSLPEGVQVVSCCVPVDRLKDVKLVLVNESDVDVLFKKNQIIADVVLYSHQYNVNSVLHDVCPRQSEAGTDVFLFQPTVMVVTVIPSNFILVKMPLLSGVIGSGGNSRAFQMFSFRGSLTSAGLGSQMSLILPLSQGQPSERGHGLFPLETLKTAGNTFRVC